VPGSEFEDRSVVVFSVVAVRVLCVISCIETVEGICDVSGVELGISELKEVRPKANDETLEVLEEVRTFLELVEAPNIDSEKIKLVLIGEATHVDDNVEDIVDAVENFCPDGAVLELFLEMTRVELEMTENLVMIVIEL
jgi:hypothetical protein